MYRESQLSPRSLHHRLAVRLLTAHVAPSHAMTRLGASMQLQH